MGVGLLCYILLGFRYQIGSAILVFDAVGRYFQDVQDWDRPRV